MIYMKFYIYISKPIECLIKATSYKYKYKKTYFIIQYIIINSFLTTSM